MKRFSLLRPISKVLLTGVLTVSLQAQQADALKLAITQGAPSPELSKKNAKREAEVEAKSPAPVIVEVRDEIGHVVPGARVQINTPASANKPLLGWTDTEGRAYIDGVIPRGQEGKTPITAEAQFNGKLGSTTFNEAAVVPPAPQIVPLFTFNKQHHRVRNTLIVAGVVGLAALGVALALTLPGGGAKAAVVAPTPTTVAIGGVTVGGPQ